MKKFWLSAWTRALLFALCLTPFLNLLWRGFHRKLTFNPIEFITHYTGDWTLRFLLITLAITPLRKLLGQPQMIRYRRMAGLFAFFYGCLHLATWIWLDKAFDLHEMWDDVVKRRFITMGMAGLLLMTPLAVTSTSGWVRRLGYRRWQLLHRLIYGSAAAGVIHYYWGVKSDIRLPVLYASILTLLLLYRIGAGVIDARKSIPATRPLRPPADARG
jgi:sulfoxide reductase heme-binding subunit YedZ